MALENQFGGNLEHKKVIESLQQLEKKLSELPLTTEGQNFQGQLREFLNNPQKYIKDDHVVSQEKTPEKKLTLEESDRKVEEFIEKAKAEGKEIWYHSFPEPDGYFWDDKKTKQKEYNSFYVMVKNPGSGNAEFMALPKNGKYKREMTNAIILDSRKAVLPVCKINEREKVGIQNAGIAQRGPGKLNLEGIKWMVRNEKIDIDLYEI